MNYKLIIFDWDGTLYDSADYFIQQTKLAASEANVPIPTESDIRKVVWLTFEAGVNSLFGHLERDDFNRFVDCYCRRLDAPKQLPAMFQGAQEVLRALKAQGYLLAVATAKLRHHFERDLLDFGLNHFFDATCCGDEALSKPHPQMLQQILLETDVTADEAVMIGDTEYDISMAQQANMHSVAVTYGFHTKEVLQRQSPSYFIDHVNELPPLLETIVLPIAIED